MAKEKQTRRLIAMALAASVATSAMPVTAFAEGAAPEGGQTSESNSITTTETKTNDDNTTTTTTTTVSGDKKDTVTGQVTMTTTVTQTTSGFVTEKSESKTTEVNTREDATNKDEVGKTSTETTTTTTTNTGSETTVTTKIDNVSSETTSDTKTQVNASAKEDQMAGEVAPFPNAPSGETVVGATAPNPDDPTGNGTNADLNTKEGLTEEQQAETEGFVSDFVEGTTITDTTKTESEHHEEHTDAEDWKERPTENSGSVSGFASSENTVTTVTKEERLESETTTEEKHVVVDENGNEQIVVDEDTLEEMEAANAFGTPTQTGTTPADTEDMYAYQNGDQLTANLDASKNEGENYLDYETAVKDLSNRYAAWVEANVTTPARTAAGTYGEGDDAVTLEVSDPETSADGKTKTFTGVKVNDDGSEIKKVVTVVEKTENGHTVFETTTTTYYTPADGAANEIVNSTHPDADPEHVTDTDYTYDFGAVEENQSLPEPVPTKIVLPERPFEGAKTDETTGHTTTYTVEEIKEVIDGVEQVVGYRQNAVLTDADGIEIGGGYQEFKGEITTTTATSKEVEKTTTIDTYTQETVVTEKTVEKEVTVTTVTLDQTTQQRMLEAWLKSVVQSGDHGVINQSWISPDSSYDERATNTGAKLYDGQWNMDTLGTFLDDWTQKMIKDFNNKFGETNQDYAANDLRQVSREDVLFGIYDWQWLDSYNESLAYDGLIEHTDYGWYGDAAGIDLTQIPADKLQYSGYGMFSEFMVYDKQGSKTNLHYVPMYELTDKNGETFYAYCTELGKGLLRGETYEMININEISNFDFEKDNAKEKIRTIALNGFWGETGTETVNGESVPKTGSLEAVKELLREYDKTLTEKEISSLTAGQAMAATQVALWTYGNAGTSGRVIDPDYLFSNMKSLTDTSLADSTSKDEKIVRALYDVLVNLPTAAPQETELLDKEDVKGAGITAKEKATEAELKAAGFEGTENTDNDKTNDVYKTDVSFTLAVIPTANDDLLVTVVDGNGKTVTTKRLAGTNKEGETYGGVTSLGNGKYQISGIQLQEGVNINLSIDGTQHLQNGVYIYQSDANNGKYSQTFVGLNQGSREVNLDVNMTFKVDEPTATTSSSSGSTTGKRAKRTTTDYHQQDQIVTALVEVTKEVVTTESTVYAGEYLEEWSYPSGGGKDPVPTPEDPTDPTDPTTPSDPSDPGDPGDVLGDEEDLMDIGDDGTPLGDKELEDPMLLGDEEIIAATGDSNHMTGAFGGMFAALAGMFLLRKKKEN